MAYLQLIWKKKEGHEWNISLALGLTLVWHMHYLLFYKIQGGLQHMRQLRANSPFHSYPHVCLNFNESEILIEKHFYFWPADHLYTFGHCTHPAFTTNNPHYISKVITIWSISVQIR